MQVPEQRFVIGLSADALEEFREVLVATARGFTEFDLLRSPKKRYIVAADRTGDGSPLARLLRQWQPRALGRRIKIETREASEDPDETFFLLPLQRNAGAEEGPRLPLFTDRELDDLRRRLVEEFDCRIEAAIAYGRWRGDDGRTIPDHHLVHRVRREDDGTVARLREFIRANVLASPACDQDSIYLSSRWLGEYVQRA